MVKVAILHEGSSKKTSDNKLLKLLIEELSLGVNDIQFIGMGGKSNFFKKDNVNYKQLKLNINSEYISKILFIIDADYETNDTIYGGYENAEKKLKEMIKELELEEYSDFYITCDPNTKDGYLESLILSTIPKNERICIDNFLNCSKFKSKDNAKSIINQIYNLGYPNAPYNFSHENFDELKEKLKKLFIK